MKVLVLLVTVISFEVVAAALEGMFWLLDWVQRTGSAAEE